MKEIEVCDFRYDVGLRTRVEKQILPTITTKNGGDSGMPMIKEKDRKRGDIANLRIRKLTPNECWRPTNGI